jgi:hypothetical protein
LIIQHCCRSHLFHHKLWLTSCWCQYHRLCSSEW